MSEGMLAAHRRVARGRGRMRNECRRSCAPCKLSAAQRGGWWQALRRRTQGCVFGQERDMGLFGLFSLLPLGGRAQCRLRACRTRQMRGQACRPGIPACTRSIRLGHASWLVHCAPWLHKYVCPSCSSFTISSKGITSSCETLRAVSPECKKNTSKYAPKVHL